MVDALEIGFAIKERRIELGLTQAQLAEAAGISKRCLWSLELGQSSGVQLNKLTAVLGALGLDLVIERSGAPTSEATGAPRPQATPSAAEAAAADGAPAPDAGRYGIDALAILTGGKR